MDTKYKLICVGGTGQMVLHYYLQLYLLGLIKHPFEAVVIDTDDVIASVSSAQQFFRDLQFGQDAVDGVQQEPIAIITTPKVPAPTADKVVTALTGRQAIGEHPVRAFFNDDTLVQTVNQGLYARPALSSVMSNRVFSDGALTGSQRRSRDTRRTERPPNRGLLWPAREVGQYVFPNSDYACDPRRAYLQ